MRKQSLALVFLSAFLVSGCLVADQRLPSNGATVTADSPYAGLWLSPWPAMLTRDSLSVAYVEGLDHYIAVRGRAKYLGQDSNNDPVEIQQTYSYLAYPARVGTRMFFSLMPVRSDEAPAYAFLEAVVKDGGRTLELREPTDEAVERAMKEGKLAWRMQEDSKVSTSSPEQLAAWIAGLSESDFKVHETFERWPAPVEDLKRKLNVTAR